MHQVCPSYFLSPCKSRQDKFDKNRPKQLLENELSDSDDISTEENDSVDTSMQIEQ